MEHQHTPKDPSTITSDPRLAEAIGKGYEPHDIKLRGIFVFVAVLAVTLFVVLSVIYGIMMALAAHDRSTDPLASPVAIKLPPVYAPLQPSRGFYGNDANDHEVLDSDDMLVMRQITEQELNAPAGLTAAGRPHMPIDQAIEKTLPLLLTKNVITTPGPQPVPAGSFEGYYGGQPIPEKKPGIWTNDMNSLNNLGN